MTAMRTFMILIAICLSFPSLAVGQVKRYLYASTPDGAQTEGRSGAGILVFDIDDGHKFVRRIDIPIFEEGLRGFTGSLKTHCVYYSTTNHRLGCFDLEKEEVVWEKTYQAGCDRSSITPDGRKIYVPTGWWYPGPDSGLLVVNAENGELINKIHRGRSQRATGLVVDARHRTTFDVDRRTGGETVGAARLIQNKRATTLLDERIAVADGLPSLILALVLVLVKDESCQNPSDHAAVDVANISSARRAAPVHGSSMRPARCSVLNRTVPRYAAARSAADSTRSGSADVRLHCAPSGPASSSSRPWFQSQNVSLT